MTPPQPDEFAPFYTGYIARVTAADPVHELRVQRERLLHFLSPLSSPEADLRYAPGKWSIKEMVGHLSDCERILSYRLLRIARGDDTPLAGFEENNYVPAAGLDRRAFADVVEEWATVRNATIALARGLPAESWERRGTANNATVSARALLYIIVGHVEHHKNVLEERYGLATT